MFSLTDPAKIDHFQHVAVEQSRLHIPILFAYDTIHGYRTIFPVPLATAQPSTRRRAADARSAPASPPRSASSRSTPDGRRLPRAALGPHRRGRGEDPYLGSVMAAARVKGCQGTDYAAPDKVVASVKHFAAYGQPEGGRDYNTTDMSRARLRNLYLPPFKAAIDAGADTVDVLVQLHQRRARAAPTSTSRPTSSRSEWGFDGFIESDYTAVAELRACPPSKPDEGPCGHGVAADGPDAGALALNAGTDSEMVSTNIRDNGKQLLGQRPDLDAPPRRRRPPDPAREVPRRAVRPPVRRRRQGAGETRPEARGPRRRAQGRRPLDGAAQERGGTLPLDPAK